MIKKLRRKFIAIAIISVTVVLIAILGTINIANYVKINLGADEILSVLTQNGGVFPKPDKTMDYGRKHMPKDMSPEAPYENRFFSVNINEDGEINTVNTDFIAAITADEAKELASKVYENGKSSGFSGDYKFQMTSDNGITLITFLDCSRDISTFQSFLLSSILVSAIGILAVFVLVIIFSKIAVRPVAQSYEKQKRFITDASHEIKTPLTIIDANTEVLEMQNGENEWTNSIKNQIQRLSSLTSSLVSLTRMDEETQNIVMTDFSLSDAIEESLEPFEKLAITQNKIMTVNIQKGLSYNGNEDAIRQLVSIFADNALKYSDENGGITVCLKKQGKFNEISFSNTVESIEKGNLDILFERFYRADASRNSKSGGYGIGLSIAKAIVEMHHGKISAKSLDGKSILIIAQI